MTPKVYDKQGVERDLAWLKSYYGAEWIPVADPTKPHFELRSVRGREGPAEISIYVRDQDGIGWGGCLTACSWPGGEIDLTSAETALFKTRFASRADVKAAEADGKTGFGTGQGDFMPEVGTGVRAGWVLHSLYPSEVLSKIGQRGGTEHEGPNLLVFQLVMGSVPETDPEPEPGPGDAVILSMPGVEAQLERIGDLLEAIGRHFGAAL